MTYCTINSMLIPVIVGFYLCDFRRCLQKTAPVPLIATTEDSMYLDHQAALRIGRVLNQIDIPALLMDEQGSVIFPEGDRRQLTLPEAVRNEPDKPLVYGGVTLIGARGDTAQRDDQQLFLCLSGDSAEVRSFAVLCAELIGMILRVDMSSADRSQAIRLILRGEVDTSELEALSSTHGIPMDMPRCVIYLNSSDLTSEQIIQKVAEMPLSENDLITDVGRHVAAIVKALPDEEALDEAAKLAADLDMSFDEVGMEVLIGVSDPCGRLTDLASAFSQARDAITVGTTYRAPERVFIHRRLLLERFLDSVPADSVSRYSSTVINSHTARLFNDEMVHTIEVFFENNLNLSEAARRLYIHRNTLVYRLEKVQRLTGFDLRRFDDAVTFKLMMLLSRADNRRQKP